MKAILQTNKLFLRNFTRDDASSRFSNDCQDEVIQCMTWNIDSFVKVAKRYLENVMCQIFRNPRY